MMMNLFSIFDPSTYTPLTMNWLAFIAIFIFSPSSYWLLPSRIHSTLFSTIKKLHQELSSMTLKPFTSLMITSFFFVILLNNMLSLSPYFFTTTAHMVVTLTFSLPMCTSILLMFIASAPSTFLANLLPVGTPPLLSPLMIMIETISMMIRPVTLAIRLSANMIAGHLLLTLLGSMFNIINPTTWPLIFLLQMSLTILELAVAMIQAYVFSVLIALYTNNH